MFAHWLQAFSELSTDRPVSMGGLGPIPSRSISEWVAGWPDNEADIFRRVMRSMDAAFLDRVRKKNDAPKATVADIDRIFGG